MSKESINANKYIYVSPKDRFSEVYDLVLNHPVIINNEENIAKNIKLGDVICFIDYSSFHKKNIEKSFIVKFVGYSQFPSTCFTGNCLIQTILGLVSVNTLHVGDIIITHQGSSVPVKCILETKINQQIDMMKHPDGLIITGYHPVKINNKWCFPKNLDLFEKQTIYVDSIYSIGLEGGISFIVNGIEVASLGHNVVDDLVMSHPYFGSNLIIRDIFKLASNGYCVIKQEQIIRDDDTKLVCGITKK